MKYVAVARNTQTNDADLRSLQNLLRKLLQGQNNHLTRRHFNQHFFWGKNAPAQIHFQVCKFSKVAFLRLLIVFPCFSGSFAFHVFWIVHSNILSCFKSLLKFTEPQREGAFYKKENLRKYCFLWQDLETVYGMRANCHLGTGGLWFVRQLLTIDNGEHNHTLRCKPPCSLEQHTLWTAIPSGPPS